MTFVLLRCRPRPSEWRQFIETLPAVVDATRVQLEAPLSLDCAPAAASPLALDCDDNSEGRRRTAGSEGAVTGGCFEAREDALLMWDVTTRRNQEQISAMIVLARRCIGSCLRGIK